MGLQQLSQMQGHLLYELCARSHEAVELRAIRQGREGASEMACGVAVEVPLAAKAGPTGEDSEGYDLAFGEGRLGASSNMPDTALRVTYYETCCHTKRLRHPTTLTELFCGPQDQQPASHPHQAQLAKRRQSQGASLFGRV